MIDLLPDAPAGFAALPNVPAGTPSLLLRKPQRRSLPLLSDDDVWAIASDSRRLVTRATGYDIGARQILDAVRHTRASRGCRREAASRLRNAAKRLMIAAEVLAPRCDQ